MDKAIRVNMPLKIFLSKRGGETLLDVGVFEADYCRKVPLKKCVLLCQEVNENRG